MNLNKDFQWQRHPKVEQFFLNLFDEIKTQNSSIASFETKLFTKTSTRLPDWVDHAIMEGNHKIRSTLADLGFRQEPEAEVEAYFHPGVLLPGIVLIEGASPLKPGLALKVENIADFLQANGFVAEIEGSPLGPYRRACVCLEKNTAFYVVERRGSRTFTPVYQEDNAVKHYLAATELWQKTSRFLDDEEQAFKELFRIADQISGMLGTDLATHIIFECERKYWLSRNYLGRVQKGRQDTMGLGWANHDHHTFRSSRKHFGKLVKFFTKLGFQLRERFYAGKEAGWGAQVVEHPTTGIALFLDVDLTPEELNIDFVNQELLERGESGTVGLWCGLHGDSILKAGLHHLAAHFDFTCLQQDLSQYGLSFMKPFSDFSYLKQAFSKGEIWDVDPARVKRLVADKLIEPQQAEQFLNKGAIGSHLENIERHEGYKGFNQKNVSVIIHDTDPRVYAAA